MDFVLAALCLFVSFIHAEPNCTITPIYIDFHDRNASHAGIQYGLFTGIGGPTSQNLSLWPSISNNETTVATLDYCNNDTFPGCATHSHGFYQPELSPRSFANSTYRSLDDLGLIPAEIDGVVFDAFNMFVHYFDPSPASLVQVPSLPITLISNYSATSTPWFGPAGMLGLGPASALLQRLADLHLISSRSLGLYVGTMYDPANGAINGSLTLGGIDSGRFAPDVHSFPVNPAIDSALNSPFRVVVSQMAMTNADGQMVDLVDNPFDAYITTLQYELDLPGLVTQKFAEVSGAMPAGDILRMPDGYNSSLTITLEGGLNITYEPEWLRNVSSNSPISSRSLVLGDSNATASEPALLGTAFLSNIYFMVNYDASPPSFYLAPALPEAPYVMTEPWCPNAMPMAAPPTTISAFSRAGLTGAIVGGVIGGIALTFVAWWLFRKLLQRRMFRKQALEAMKTEALDGRAKKNESAWTLTAGPHRGGSEMATFVLDDHTKEPQQAQKKGSSEHLNTPIAPAPLRDLSIAQSALDDPQARAQSYLEHRNDFLSSNSAPLTPATGVPLLQNHGRSFDAGADTDDALAGASNFTPFISDALPLRKQSAESSLRHGLNLNVQTQFGSRTKSRVGGSKGSLLRKALPPSNLGWR